MARTNSNLGFLSTQGQVTLKVNSRILPDFNLIKDLMPALFMCKFHNELLKNKISNSSEIKCLVTFKTEEDLIKNKCTVMCTTFFSGA